MELRLRIDSLSTTLSVVGKLPEPRAVRLDGVEGHGKALLVGLRIFRAPRTKDDGLAVSEEKRPARLPAVEVGDLHRIRAVNVGLP
jgi:hypothetical protein